MSDSPVILMYHRVGRVPVDPWALAVTPDHFSAQLAVLKAERDVVPLEWLAAELGAGRCPRNAAALTFDDGYADVLLNGLPVLEAHDCPCTLFIVTGALGQPGFWWDDLSSIVLGPASLPESLSLTIGCCRHAWTLAKEAPSAADAHRGGSVTRAQLHLEIWRLLKPLAPDLRQGLLRELAAWAGTGGHLRPHDRVLTHAEMQALAGHGAITIGAHTLTHPSLPLLDDRERRLQVRESRAACEALAGRPVTGFSYPFGDIDRESREAVRDAGFAFACTTSGQAISPATDLLQLPRATVGDWDAEEFRLHLFDAG